MKSVKTKKMMMVLPLLVIPFLTMAFWALGGGKKKVQSNETAKGLNLDLPDANLKEDKLMDKLGFYDKADKDSMKREEWMRSDPYFKRDTTPFEIEEMLNSSAGRYNLRLNTSPYEKGSANPEQQIMDKLKLLQQEMNRTEVPAGKVQVSQENEFSSEVDRLEQMLKVNNTGTTDDPEMKQLDGTLEKILDIQHPQRVKERLKERSLQNRESVYAVRRVTGNDTIVKGFYSLEDSQWEQEEQNAIEAEVYANQTLVNGSVIKFRLLNDIFINGKSVPKGTFVFGIAALEGERLTIEISSIKSAKNLFNVKLEVYDVDGLPGIYIPGTISRDVAKQSADNSLSLLEMTSVDPSLKGQATAAGIGTIKSLLSKKVKLVKVLVKAGYKVFLKDKNIEK